jgi:hypothetical protein
VSFPARILAQLQVFLAQGAFMLCAIKHGNVHILWILLKIRTPKRICRFFFFFTEKAKEKYHVQADIWK